MDEGLTACEVELLHPEAHALRHPRAHLRARHERVAFLARAARDEAVSAAQVAECARHLDPQRIQVRERLEGEAAPARRHSSRGRRRRRRDGTHGPPGERQPHGSALLERFGRTSVRGIGHLSKHLPCKVMGSSGWESGRSL